jgi:hypothetical protein
MRAATGSDDGTIKFWDLANFSCLTTIKAHLSGVKVLQQFG